MASASITRRATKAGEARYAVRYRLGGRAYPVSHGGSFATMKEARARRDPSRASSPRDGTRPTPARHDRAAEGGMFAEWAEAYRASRPDIGDETRKNTSSHLKRLLPAFGERDPNTITSNEVQEWIGA